jgi:acyl-CoA synthetase (AMP-forming)/AMP-acid ligase II
MSTTWKFGELPVRGQVPIGQVGRHPNIYLEPTDDPSALEVWARGSIASGYTDQKKAIERFITDLKGERWWKSGDIVTIEPESNYYHYAHRLDDVIKVRDHRVSLQDIEREILAIPKTKYAAVKHLEVRSRNLIVAFVQREKKSQVTPEEILDNLRGSLPSFSMPNYIILCAELPLSPRQKTSLPTLMALAAKHFNVSPDDIKTPKI